jgi:hypothetical protein
MFEGIDSEGSSRRHDTEHPFESSARVLIQFVVRAVALPFNLLMAKPVSIARAAMSGDYRPLPSPFLLALTAGVGVSGAISSMGVFFSGTKSWANAFTEYLAAVVNFYTQNIGGAQAILYAVPYVFALWVIAGLISLFMLRGVRVAEAVFAAISLCFAALIEVFAVLIALISFAPFTWGEGAEIIIVAGVSIYALLLAVKLIRVVFALRHEHGVPLVGAVIASIPCFLLVSMVGVVGAGLLWSVVLLQRADAGLKGKDEAVVEVVAPSGPTSGDQPPPPAATEPVPLAPVATAPTPDN